MAIITISGKWNYSKYKHFIEIMNNPTLRPRLNWTNKIIPVLEIVIEDGEGTS